MHGRSWIALALVVVAAVLLVALRPPPAEGDPGPYAVTVTGPEGIVFTGVVDVDDPSALGALDAASAVGGFTYQTDRYPQFGCGVYVRSIADHRAAGAEGWVYEVVRDGERSRPSMPSCAFALRPGDEVHWLWATAG